MDIGFQEKKTMEQQAVDLNLCMKAKPGLTSRIQAVLGITPVRLILDFVAEFAEHPALWQKIRCLAV